MKVRLLLLGAATVCLISLIGCSPMEMGVSRQPEPQTQTTTIPIASPTPSSTPISTPTPSPTPSPSGTPYPPSPGWTEFTPSADTRMVYVSSSVGDSSFDGLSPDPVAGTLHGPKKFLGEANDLLRDGYPDWLLMRSGDVWENQQLTFTKSGRSPTEMMVVKSYGQGPRPRIEMDTGNPVAGVVAMHCLHEPPFTCPPDLNHHSLAITDLHLKQRAPGGGSEGIAFGNSWRHVVLENLYIEHFGIGIIFQLIDGNASPRMNDIRIRRNVVVDSFIASNEGSTCGIFVAGVDNFLLEENVIDHNGWNESVPSIPPNIFRHNTYITVDNTNVVTRGNIIARAASTGLGQRGGGIAENNLLLQNPLNAFMGHGSQSPPFSVGGSMRYNVVLDSRDIGLDPRGMGMGVSHASGLEIHHNIIAHQRTGTGNISGLGADFTIENLNLHHNIVYNWTLPGSSSGGLSMAFNPTALRGMNQIHNNQLQQPLGGQLIAPEGVMANPAFFHFTENTYFSPNALIGGGLTMGQWLAVTGEPASAVTQVNYPAPMSDISTYMNRAYGDPQGLELFLQGARLQARDHWDPRFTAQNVNTYIRNAFGMGEP